MEFCPPTRSAAADAHAEAGSCRPRAGAERIDAAFQELARDGDRLVAGSEWQITEMLAAFFGLSEGHRCSTELDVPVLAVVDVDNAVLVVSL